MMQRLRVRNLGSDAGDRIETDRQGRLYDRNVRDSLARWGKIEAEPLEAVAALRLAASRVHAEMERWTEAHGLSESRLRVLMSIYYATGRRRALGELAEALNVVPRTITDIVDTLERDGLIRRMPAEDDRRSIHAVLTARGTTRVESMRREAVDRQTALFAGLSKAQMVELRHLCLMLVRGLAAHGGEA